MTKNKILLLIAALVALAVAALGLADLGAASTSTTAARARPVIVDVTGDAANGFEITYADGTGLYPPTDSEARAECSEYDTRAARVKCRAEVRTWYRDLGDLKASLAYVREHG